jgi:hypothetical protein
MRPRKKAWVCAFGEKWRTLSNAFLLTPIFGASALEDIGA